ncbi:MAG: hypothetical protein HC938_01960 [Nitrospira sp.]|nr:hypothetical protein [Nitrospira sp.]
MKLAPYFGTLALLIILFDGGINLHIMKVVSETPMALLYSVMVFGMTILTIMGFYVWITHASWLHGLLLGTILGGTAAAIIIPVMSHMSSLRDSTKVMLSLDSAISEVFVVVLALALMGTMKDPDGGGHFIRGNIFMPFWGCDHACAPGRSAVGRGCWHGSKGKRCRTCSRWRRFWCCIMWRN